MGSLHSNHPGELPWWTLGLVGFDSDLPLLSPLRTWSIHLLSVFPSCLDPHSICIHESFGCNQFWLTFIGRELGHSQNQQKGYRIGQSQGSRVAKAQVSLVAQATATTATATTATGPPAPLLWPISPEHLAIPQTSTATLLPRIIPDGPLRLCMVSLDSKSQAGACNWLPLNPC